MKMECDIICDDLLFCDVICDECEFCKIPYVFFPLLTNDDMCDVMMSDVAMFTML